MERWYGTFGIVEIDKYLVWRLPSDLSDKTDDEVMAAFRLAYNPPHPVDGCGERMLADMRAWLADELRGRGVLRE